MLAGGVRLSRSCDLPWSWLHHLHAPPRPRTMASTPNASVTHVAAFALLAGGALAGLGIVRRRRAAAASEAEAAPLHAPSTGAAGAAAAPDVPSPAPHEAGLSLATRAAHAGLSAYSTGDVTPALHLASTYRRREDLSYHAGMVYGRCGNPTRLAAERAVEALEAGASGEGVDAAALEGDCGRRCALFASGMAAGGTLLQASGARTRVLLSDDVYFGVRSLLSGSFARDWHMKWSSVDMRDVGAVEAALARARDADGTDCACLVWLELPTNPMLRLCDVSAIARVAKRYGAMVVVDATWLTPALLQPLALGADFVLHSATKYMGGHSDLLAGALVCTERLSPAAARVWKQVRWLQESFGAIAAPFDCWLLLRGLRSLSVRMARHCRSAARIAAWLAEHPIVEAVIYPGHPSHPQHALAQKLTAEGAPRASGAPAEDVQYGGMLSILVKGGRDAALRVSNRLVLFTRATSLGGTESLVEHRQSIEGPDTQTPANLLRLSVGLEDVTDLIADLSRALGGELDKEMT